MNLIYPLTLYNYIRRISLLLILTCLLQPLAAQDTIDPPVVDSQMLNVPAADDVNENVDIGESAYDETSPGTELDDIRAHRTVDPTTWKRFRADKDLKYYDIRQAPRDNWFFRFLGWIAGYIMAIKWVIAALLLAGIGWLAFRFIRQNGLRIFRKTADANNDNKPEEQLQNTSAYETKIREAAEAGDYRQAIRWWYLYILFRLSAQQLITYGSDKTNREYLRALQPTPFYKPFATLTLDYEYIWYGGFEVDEAQYRAIDTQFGNFVHQIGQAS